MRINSNIPEKAEQWAKDLEKQVDDAVYKSMTRTGLVGESRVKGIIAKEAHDTGRLLRSVHAVIRRNPDLMKLTIGTNLEYAFFVEEGRKPGKWPNLNALVGWTGRKMKGGRVNVSFDQLKALAKGKGAGAKAAREQLSFIYLVGRKIATRGIREKLIFRRIEAGLLALFRQDVKNRLQSLR